MYVLLDVELRLATSPDLAPSEATRTTERPFTLIESQLTVPHSILVLSPSILPGTGIFSDR